ncbi:MAG TPA: isocitrate lyase/phosphoenolpyruvate mutase family protein [Tepidisphaeraceae bacterium]|nr:isocitrate lyase/phosphoenolpyruvate mutase family protein [Tepidisphaeraceae bacterium]
MIRQSASMAAKLRKLMRRSCVAMPGAFNAATARLIERAGFDAVYVSGAGLSNAAAGVPDIGLLSRRQVAELAGFIAAAVKVPVIVDADTGFGGPRDAAATVEQFARAGIAGMHMEDQVSAKRCGHLGGKMLITPVAMSAKIRAAVASRKRHDFLVIARTDARSVEGFGAAARRARMYLDAGADAIFPEALESEDEFAEFARLVRAPLMANMTEFGKSPLLGLGKLAQLGYRLVIFPQTAFRVAMKAEEKLLRDLRRLGTQRQWLGKMQTRRELYDLLDYKPGA